MKRWQDFEDFRATKRPAPEHGIKVKQVGTTWWGQRWIESKVSLENLDVQLLMWDMRRGLDTKPMPRRKSTIQFQYTDAPTGQRAWWLVVAPGADTDLCSLDPGFDIDLYVTSDLKTMTAIWMGMETVRHAVSTGCMKLVGDKQLASNMQTWLGLSPFAKEKRMVA